MVIALGKPSVVPLLLVLVRRHGGRVRARRSRFYFIVVDQQRRSRLEPLSPRHFPTSTRVFRSPRHFFGKTSAMSTAANHRPNDGQQFEVLGPHVFTNRRLQNAGNNGQMSTMFFNMTMRYASAVSSSKRRLIELLLLLNVSSIVVYRHPVVGAVYIITLRFPNSRLSSHSVCSSMCT